MKTSHLKSIALVIASMSLAMPLLIGMIHIGTRLSAHGLAAALGCFLVWGIAAAYLVSHFLGKTKDEHQE